MTAVFLAACRSGGSDPPAPLDNDRDTFVASTDCNDNDASVHTPMPYAARDADGDMILAPSAGSVCGNGVALPATYFANVGSGEADCDDQNASVHTPMLYAARDADGDMILAPSAGSVCGNGVALPATYFANAGSGEADCDDQNASLWRVSSFFDDLDGDGIGHGSARSVCVGNGTPSGLVVAPGFDCNPLSATQWRMVVTYTDVDGDGVGSGPLQPLCVGSAPPPGSSFLGFDPLDSLTDPMSTLISDFDLNVPSLIVDSSFVDDD